MWMFNENQTPRMLMWSWNEVMNEYAKEYNGIRQCKNENLLKWWMSECNEMMTLGGKIIYILNTKCKIKEWPTTWNLL